jgi:hypothetical protein
MPPTADAARAFNQQLRATALALAAQARGDHKYAFLCECGCEQTVMATISEYDQHGGAWLTGHRPSPLGRSI